MNFDIRKLTSKVFEMGDVIIDAITRWLDETSENLTFLEREGLMKFLEITMIDAFEKTKEKALRIIETGQPEDRILPNIGLYAERKARGLIYSQRFQSWIVVPPTTHGLGRLTEGLYMGVENTPIGGVKVTRGKEVRIYTKFNDPEYISDVHDGKAGTAGGRPFLLIAAEELEMILEEAVEKYLERLNLVSPPPAFISTLITHSALRGVTVF